MIWYDIWFFLYIYWACSITSGAILHAITFQHELYIFVIVCQSILILYNLAGVLSALRSGHACLLAIVRLLLHSSSVSRWRSIWYDMIWYDMIWYDMIWYDMIWYDMICYDMIWYDMIWYDMIWYDMIWYDIWYDMIWYDMIWYDIFNCNWVATRW
jgi:hypothetical protein